MVTNGATGVECFRQCHGATRLHSPGSHRPHRLRVRRLKQILFDLRHGKSQAIQRIIDFVQAAFFAGRRVSGIPAVRAYERRRNALAISSGSVWPVCASADNKSSQSGERFDGVKLRGGWASAGKVRFDLTADDFEARTRKHNLVVALDHQFKVSVNFASIRPDATGGARQAKRDSPEVAERVVRWWKLCHKATSFSCVADPARLNSRKLWRAGFHQQQMRAAASRQLGG